MVLRVRFLVIALAAFACGPALAQDTVPEPETAAEPGLADIANASASDREARLDRLFDSLAEAKNADEAKRFETTIESLWQRSGSDTADLFALRAVDLLTSGDDSDGALKMLDAALEAKPDYAEGWNKRATLFFLKGDYPRAMRDIRETLRHEPRHYGAWSCLGRILEQTGDDRRALDAYRRALAIHPNLEGLKDEAGKLATKLRGEEL